MNYQLVHELIFGALIGNIVIFFGLIKTLLKVYSDFHRWKIEHEELYKDFEYRESLRRDREQGNLIRKQKRFNFNKEKREDDNGDSNSY